MLIEILLGGILFLLILSFGVSAFALKHIYQFPQTKQTANPDRLKLAFDRVKISTDDNSHIAACYFPATSEHAPGIVLMHGWGQSSQNLYPLIPLLHQAGLAVLAIDARNHGDSDKSNQSSLLQFAEDINTGLDWLANRPEIKNKQLMILGHSIGAAAGLLVSSTDTRIRGVISISSFAHSVTHLRRVLKNLHIPYWPLGWAIIRYKQFSQGFDFDQVAPVNTVSKISTHILLTHAEDDTVVPISDALTIYEKCQQNRDQLLILSKGGHLPIRALLKQNKALKSFIDSCQ